MIFEASSRPRLSTDEMAAGQCTHPVWRRNGFDAKTGKQVERCPMCGKRRVQGAARSLEPVLVSRLKFVPLWLQGIPPMEAAQRLRVSYHTVVIHYRALRELYREHTGEIRRVDGRIKNTFTPEAQALGTRVSAELRSKAAGA